MSINAPLMPRSSDVGAVKGSRRGGGASFLGSIANLANAAVGSGVLLLPDAFRLAGLVVGPLIVLSCACLLGFSLHVLGISSDYARKKHGSAASYQEIVMVILGSRAGHAINFFQLLCVLCVFGTLAGQLVTGRVARRPGCPPRNCQVPHRLVHRLSNHHDRSAPARAACVPREGLVLDTVQQLDHLDHLVRLPPPPPPPPRDRHCRCRSSRYTPAAVSPAAADA